MNTIKKSLVAFLAIVSMGLSLSYAGKEGEGHKHEVIPPNGGRMIQSLDPQAEVYVAEDGLVRVTFVNDHGEVVPVADEVVSLVGGDRMNPISLAFVKDGDSFVSEGKLPVGKMIPLVVQIKKDSASSVVRERFNLNLGECPSCDYKEYACRCHDEKPSHGHGHSHGGDSHSH